MSEDAGAFNINAGNAVASTNEIIQMAQQQLTPESLSNAYFNSLTQDESEKPLTAEQEKFLESYEQDKSTAGDLSVSIQYTPDAQELQAAVFNATSTAANTFHEQSQVQSIVTMVESAYSNEVPANAQGFIDSTIAKDASGVLNSLGEHIYL